MGLLNSPIEELPDIPNDERKISIINKTGMRKLPLSHDLQDID